MSFQWTVIAVYLYFEIALVMILILPIFSPKRWYHFFRSRLFALIYDSAAVYFYVFLGVLSLFLFDAIREMRKYSNASDSQMHLANEMKGHIKLFRAQRNFYITGFAIFLAFVIKRLVTMIIIEHELELKAEQIIRKAEDTVKLAKTTVLANTIQNSDDLNKKLEETQDLLKEEKLRVKDLEEEVTKWRSKYEQLNLSLQSKASGDD